MRNFLNLITKNNITPPIIDVQAIILNDKKFKFRIFIISPIANAGATEIITNLKLFENSFLRLSELFLYKYTIKAKNDEKCSVVSYRKFLLWLSLYKISMILRCPLELTGINYVIPCIKKYNKMNDYE